LSGCHGFYVTSDEAEFVYKCTDFYAPEYERSIIWNDPDIGIRWPLMGDVPLLSEKIGRGERLGMQIYLSENIDHNLIAIIYLIEDG
jgi:dTDP-4-dehydrorhamnose 3,5-epimerase